MSIPPKPTANRFRPVIERLEPREAPAAIAIADFYSIRGGRTLSSIQPNRFGVAGVLLNDFDDALVPISNRGMTAFLNAPPTDTATGLPVVTQFSFANNGGFVFRAPKNFNGVVQFNYRAVTANGLISPSTPVFITVTSSIRRLAVGADQGSDSTVAVYDPTTKFQLFAFNAFDGGFKGGVRVATGDFNRDNIDDIVVVAGPSAGPHVKIFDGRTGGQIASFFAFDQGFNGGLEVAVGDLNGDGADDLVVSAGSGPNAHVKVFNGTRLSDPAFDPDKPTNVLASFFAYGGGETNGVRVAVGDVDGNEVNKLITAPAQGSTLVKVFDVSSGNAIETKTFFGGNRDDTRGLFVTSGDFDGDYTDEIAVGSGSGTPEARIYSAVFGDRSTMVLTRGIGAGSFTDNFVSDSFTTPINTNGVPNYLLGTLTSPAGAQTGLVGRPNASKPGNLQGYTGGLRVTVDYANLDNNADLVLAQGPGGFPRVQVLSGLDFSTLADFTVFPGFFGGLNVGGRF